MLSTHRTRHRSSEVDRYSPTYEQHHDKSHRLWPSQDERVSRYATGLATKTGGLMNGCVSIHSQSR
jgi:hypothetical protein